MDLLKAAINSEVKKRKSQYDKVASSKDNHTHKKRYVRVADLENEDKEDEKPLVTIQDKHVQKPDTQQPPKDTEDLVCVISSEEVIKRLRARSEPIRLFGESDRQRQKRLRQLELSEETKDGQQNEFNKVLAQVEAGAMLEDLKRNAKMTDDNEDERRRKRKFELVENYDVSGISLDLLRTDINRLYTLLYVYLKRVLYEWEDFLVCRPEDERRSADGKMAAATQRQSAEYLRPLFRNLKHHKVPADVLARITEIARSMLDREYMKANDAYLQLSIGNAPWPLGVTQVGIHTRAARENIKSSKVAHVLNDEVQRKWIQSIKRLMRFAQQKYPPDDLAKMVG